ncbi:MAG: phosphatase domain-containing protein [Oligoflexia bacterium]|nr:phosphatase domain-containing protein [Oligoflexia bacterium]
MADPKTEFIRNGDVFFYKYVKDQEIGDVVYVWDIDKTYLDTNFDSLRGLLKTAFEKAFQKTNVPGTATLIRAMTKSLDSSHPPAVFFLSASPPQMETKIYQKMKIDGLNPFGMLLKDNLKNFRPRKFKRLKHQVGYKVQALLELRVYLKKSVKMVLFGDDSESDAVVYSLFSDICKRRLKHVEILSILEALYVLPQQRQRIMELQALVPEEDPVEKIYINLVADTDPDYYSKFGRRVLATFTTFQAALDLCQDGRIDDESLLMVARDMINNYSFTPEELAKSFEDLHKRDFLRNETQNRLIPHLKENGFLPSNFASSIHPVKTLQKIGEKILGLNIEDPWVPDHIDYLNDFR